LHILYYRQLGVEMILRAQPTRSYFWVLMFLVLACTGLLIGDSRDVVSASAPAPVFRSLVPPTINIALAAAGPYRDPATVTINATAANPGGGIVTRVEFFEGNSLLGQDLQAPFVYNWVGVSAGNYNLRARATNDQGQTTWSNLINFSVVAYPTLSIASPNPNEGIATGNAIVLTSNATDKDGAVVKVDYTEGLNLLGTGTDAGALFNFVWLAPPAGFHTVTAVATDSDGNQSVPTNVTVFVGPAPTVNVTAASPTSGAPFAETDQVTVTVTANATAPTTIAEISLREGNEPRGNLNLASPTYTFDQIGYQRTLEAIVKDSMGVETRTPFIVPVTRGLRFDRRVINGINVGQTKLFDARSLALMLQSMQSHLANRDFFDQGTIAAAINKLQGARLDTSSLAANVSTAPIPGVTTTTNTSGTGITEIVTQPTSPSGSPTPFPGVTTTTTNSPTTVQQAVTQAALSPTVPSPPAQNTAFTFQPTVDQAPQTLLAKQISMNYEIANLRLLLEGAISDRMMEQPIYVGDAMFPSTAARARAIVGFRISLDSPNVYKKAVAEVEITVRTKCCSANSITMPLSTQGSPSLVSLVPMESNFNVATVSKNAKQFGLGVAVQPISFGLASLKTKEQLYLIQDQDIVAFEGRRSYPPVRTDESMSVTFGWQFRPVLGQEVVRAGPRQVYASLALPNTQASDFRGTVEVHTYWRRYDSKRKTVGEPIAGSDRYESLDDLVVGSKLLRGESLMPTVREVHYQDYGLGKVMVWVRGENFLPGTQVVIGDQRLDNADRGLFIQGEQDLVFVTPASLLALSEQPRILGQFGPPVPICLEGLLRPDNKTCAPEVSTATEANFGLKIAAVQITPVDLQTSRLTILMSSRNNAPPKQDLKPVVIVGQSAYGIGGNPVGSRRTKAMVELSLTVPTQALRDARKIVVKELFGGADYTDEVALRDNALVTMPDDFTATGVVLLSSDDIQADLAITGSNLSRNVHITIGDIDQPAQLAPCPAHAPAPPPGAGGAPGVAAPPTPCLNRVNSTLLLLHVPAAKLKAAKQIVVQQGSAQPVMLAVTAPPPPIPKPTVTAIDAISVNDENEVKVVGTFLTSVDKVLFRANVLLFDPAKDGSSGTLRVTKDLSDSPGSKSLDFVSKDGSKVTGTIVVNPRPGSR
jgi:hypothetical protein